MDNTSVDSLVKQGHTLADKAADKVAEARDDAGPLLKKATNQARTIGKQGIDAVNDALSQARNTASDASESIAAYTKKNPVKALAIAASAGALLYAAIKALMPSRD